MAIATDEPHENWVGYSCMVKSCPEFPDKEYINEVSEMETIFPYWCNFYHLEYGSLISLNSYGTLHYFKYVKTRVYRKKILIEVRVNGFLKSPRS